MVAEWILKAAEKLIDLFLRGRREKAQSRRETARRARDQVAPMVQTLGMETRRLLDSLADDPCPLWIHCIDQTVDRGKFVDSPKFVTFAEMLSNCQAPLFVQAGLGDIAKDLDGSAQAMTDYSRSMYEWWISFYEYLLFLSTRDDPPEDVTALQSLLLWWPSSSGYARLDVLKCTLLGANRQAGALGEGARTALVQYCKAQGADLSHTPEWLHACLSSIARGFGFVHPNACIAASWHHSCLQPSLARLHASLESARKLCCE